MRARSLTLIDQRQGQAVSWSRQCYYAGLAPSRGLQFPPDAAVYPIVQEPTAGRGGGRRPPASDRWDEDQHLAAGYISFAEFVAVSGGPLAGRDAGLAGQRNRRGREPPPVVNRLGVPLDLVYVWDSRGRLFVDREIAAGERFPPRPASAGYASQAYRLAFNDAPAGVSARLRRPLLRAAVRLPPLLLLEQHRCEPARADVRKEPAGTRACRKRSRTVCRQLPPRSYVAIAPQRAGVPAGLSGVARGGQLSRDRGDRGDDRAGHELTRRR